MAVLPLPLGCMAVRLQTAVDTYATLPCPHSPYVPTALHLCQGLNYIVAVLLLALERDEEEAFWLLAAIVERISYKASFGANLQGCHVEMKTLQVRQQRVRVQGK